MQSLIKVRPLPPLPTVILSIFKFWILWSVFDLIITSSGWETLFTYPHYVVFDLIITVCCLETNKRKRGSSFNDNHVKESKVARPSINHLLDDIAVMGLPFKTTIEELREYFETGYGELAFLEVSSLFETFLLLKNCSFFCFIYSTELIPVVDQLVMCLVLSTF